MRYPQGDVKHWLETIWAMSPLNRFYNLVPHNGIYVEREGARPVAPEKQLRLFVWRHRRTGVTNCRYVYYADEVDSLKRWARQYGHEVLAVARFKGDHDGQHPFTWR